MTHLASSVTCRAIGKNLPLLGGCSRAHVPLFLSARNYLYKQDKKYIFPKSVPTKFRAPTATLVDPEFFKGKDATNEDITWSSGEVNHPLTDDPIQDYPVPLPDGGLQYYGFTYYPRFPEQVETIPEEEISPLFMVRRVVRFNGLEWWHKNTFKELGLGKLEKLSKVIIVKNVPEMNEKLWSVKHLIEITPLKLPANLPLDADPSHCFITDEGEFLYNPSINLTAEDLQEPEHVTKVKLTHRQLHEDSHKRFFDAWEMIP